MKSILSLMIFLATLGLAQAQFTTLIGPETRNGSFDDDTDPTDQRNFEQTPFWENIAGSQNANATRTNLDNGSGTRNLLLTHATTVIPGQDTGHTIAAGDVFSVAYEWRDAFNWADGVDRVRVVLFTTDDDTIGGTRTTIAFTDSGLSTLNNTYEYVDALDFYTASPADIGKRLFVAIETVNNDGNGFGRLEDFFLEVGTSTVDPVLSVTSGDYAFGEIFHLDGTSTTSRTVTFANSGVSEDLTLDAITLNDDGGGVFSITSAPTNGTVVPPGETFEVEITATGGGGHTDLVGELLVDTDADDQDTTVPITATISTSGDPVNLLYVNNPDLDNFTPRDPPEDGSVSIWNGYSVATAGLKSAHGARLKGTGDPSTDPARGELLFDNLSQTFKGQVFPDFRATVCFAIPAFEDWTGFAPDASYPDRSFHLAILGTTTLTAGGDYDDVQTADAIIDLFYLPGGTTADPGAGFFLYDGPAGAFTRLAALGTLLESTGFTGTGEPPTNLNTYQLTIAGDDFGSANASYDIAISGANTSTVAATVTGLTTYHGMSPATTTAKAIALTTADASTATGDLDLRDSPTIGQPSFWVDQVHVEVPGTLPIAAGELVDAPDVVKTLGNEVLTTSFTVASTGIGRDLTVESAVFGDSRFSLLSPSLPVSIAPGDTQVFEVEIDLSAESETQIISTTGTFVDNDFITPTAVLNLEAQVLATGQRLLVDYDDGLDNGMHEASLRNGGFEDGTVGDTFVDTPVWTSAFAPEGNGIVGTLDTSPATGLLHGQATGWQEPGVRAQPNQLFSLSEWTLQEGDTITVSYSAMAGMDWDGQNPQIIVEVLDADGNFVSDAANSGGSAAWRWAAVTSAFAGDGSTYERFTVTTTEIQPGSPWIGNRVQVRFLKGAAREAFINIDDVTITGNMKLPVTSALEVTAIDFDPGTKDVTIRFVDTGAGSYTIESDADLDFAAGVTDYPLDGSEDTGSYPGEIEFTFNDPTATGSFHSWRVRAD